MKIEYLGRRPRQVVPASGGATFVAKPGETYDVDEATAKSLLEQPHRFREVKPTKKAAKKTAKKTTSKSGTDKENNDG